MRPIRRSPPIGPLDLRWKRRQAPPLPGLSARPAVQLRLAHDCHAAAAPGDRHIPRSWNAPLLRLGRQGTSSRNDRGPNCASRGALSLADPLRAALSLLAQIAQPWFPCFETGQVWRSAVRLPGILFLCTLAALFPGQGHHWPGNNAKYQKLE